jgi:hypothetical protein
MEFTPSKSDYIYNEFEKLNEYPKTFQELLDAPCRVINLDHNTTRWETSKERIREAGFTNIQRFSAVNAKNDEELYNGWKSLGFPKFAYKYDIGFLTNIGIQGCFLSHFKIWKEIIDNKIPYMVVFEDDVLFHPHWNILAPTYFEKTPVGYDILYMGNRNNNDAEFHIEVNIPVYCLHAVVLTYNGVKKMWDMLLNLSVGVYAIDDMIKGIVHKNRIYNTNDSFIAIIWNVAKFFPCDEIKNMTYYWKIRNNGLVFQDEVFGTDVDKRHLLQNRNIQ